MGNQKQCQIQQEGDAKEQRGTNAEQEKCSRNVPTTQH